MRQEKRAKKVLPSNVTVTWYQWNVNLNFSTMKLGIHIEKREITNSNFGLLHLVSSKTISLILWSFVHSWPSRFFMLLLRVVLINSCSMPYPHIHIWWRLLHFLSLLLSQVSFLYSVSVVSATYNTTTLRYFQNLIKQMYDLISWYLVIFPLTITKNVKMFLFAFISNSIVTYTVDCAFVEQQCLYFCKAHFFSFFISSIFRNKVYLVLFWWVLLTALLLSFILSSQPVSCTFFGIWIDLYFFYLATTYFCYGLKYSLVI